MLNDFSIFFCCQILSPLLPVLKTALLFVEFFFTWTHNCRYIIPLSLNFITSQVLLDQISSVLCTAEGHCEISENLSLNPFARNRVDGLHKRSDRLDAPCADQPARLRTVAGPSRLNYSLATAIHFEIIKSF